jgi:photosystem II stability/assembly factor-like uncharacterized protein
MICLILLIIALAGCTLGDSLKPPTPTAPPAPASASPTAPAQEDTALPGGVAAARLLDPRRGWAIAGQELYWTGDSGKTWRSITPAISIGTSLGSAFFLNQTRGWLLLCEPQGDDAQVTVASTGDAGATWQLHTLATAMEVTLHADPFFCGRISRGRLFFLDERQGWALLDHTETMNSFVAELYQTADGGQTWQHLGSTSSGEFLFVSPREGWMRAACCTGAPSQLYRSQDGGASWHAQSIQGSGADDEFFLPFFYAPGKGILPAALREDGIALSGLSFFMTLDGGESWSLKAALFPGPSVLDAGAVFDADVFDERAWAAAIPGAGTFWTLDGGQDWMVNVSAVAISVLSLGSPVDAWGLQCLEGAAPDCVQLMHTSDGGAHWLPVSAAP